MSKEDLELFYKKLLEASVVSESIELADLLETDLIENPSKISWIFENAIKNKDMKIIKSLLSLDVQVGVLNESNQTALHLAVYHNFFEIVDLLFSRCRSDLNYSDKNGLTHFHVACITGNLDVVQRFISTGLDVNQRYCSDSPDEWNLFSPLHFAVKYERVGIVEALLRSGAEPNAFDSGQATALHLLCRGLSQKVKKLVGQQNFALDDDWESYLDRRDQLEILRLLTKYGSWVDARDQSGNTPMMAVFSEDYLDQTNEFTLYSFLRNVNAKYKVIREGQRKKKEAIEILLRSNASPNISNECGETVLYLAVSDLKSLCRPKIFSGVHFDDSANADLVRVLLEHGAQVDAVNGKGLSPLQIAVSLLNYHAVRVLLDHSADFNCIKFADLQEYYAGILPSLETTEDLLGIVELLIGRGFPLSHKDNLAILKFLVCNNVHCRYADSSDENAFYKLKNLLELGASKNIKNALGKYPDTEKRLDLSFAEQLMRKRVMGQIGKHLAILDVGRLYSCEESRECLESTLSSLKGCLLRFLDAESRPNPGELGQLDAEVQLMKATMLGGQSSLHDVLRKSPRRSYPRIKRCEYGPVLRAPDFWARFPHSGGIVKGHFAKSLVSRYVLGSAADCLMAGLLGRGLPELCCDKILGHLSNECLLNLCLAASEEPAV